MTTLVLARAPITAALVAMLEQHTGRPGFAMRLPKDVDALPEPPYWILYPLPGGPMTGGMESGTEDADLLYQITSVAYDDAGVEWMADKARGGMLRGDVELPPGFSHRIRDRRTASGPGGSEPEGGMVSVAETYVVSVTPA